MTPKPILKPIQEPLFLGSKEPKKSPAKKPKAGDYTPEFTALWLSWPANRRRVSNKQTAFRRFLDGSKRYGHEAIAKAAENYLSQRDTQKENFRYCCLVEVFMNGKLEAAVEDALGSLPAQGQQCWDDRLKDWVNV